MSFHQKRSRRYDAHIQNIPEKANRILNVILFAIVLIVIRIWYLSVIQYDAKVEEARKPRAKVVVEPAKRATIRDRFNLPLAINMMRYQAAVLYSQLSQIPSIAWEIDANGKRVKKFKRKEYITKLSQLLGKELEMDPERIEDLIHSKASFFHQVPFVIKEDITEKQYYRLKMLEKDWHGIQVQNIPKRHYPLGKVASDIIGYMGAMNRTEYDAIIHEMRSLEKYLKEEENGEEVELPEGMTSSSQVRNRFQELQEKAYTINDHIGKTGIEKMFEEELRGYHGRRSYYSDARGNFLRELPGAREPLSGHRLLLTISSELQDYAEKLLAQNEQIRQGKTSKELGQNAAILKQPWIKGGAIVVMDPHNGEVLALASHPRFDPNDFVASGNQSKNQEKRSNILHWFENETFIGELWDHKRPLTRELVNRKTFQYSEEEKMMSWEYFLDTIFPINSSLGEVMKRVTQVRQALSVQKDAKHLLELTGGKNLYQVFNRLYQGEEGHVSFQSSHYSNQEVFDSNFRRYPKQISEIKKRLDIFFVDVKNNYDKVLLVDLCQLAVCSDRFNEELNHHVGKQKISQHLEASAAMTVISDNIRKKARTLYQKLDFKDWRQENEKDFLKQKRKDEKLAKQYAKPYIDYLDAKETEMFNSFWERNFWTLLTLFLNQSTDPQLIPENLVPYFEAFQLWHTEITQNGGPFATHYQILKDSLKGLSPAVAVDYLKTMRGFNDLNRPLFGKYRHMRSQNGVQTEKNLAAAFYPIYGYGYGRSQAYRQAAIQGSIFKLVTSHEALRQRYEHLAERGESFSKLNPLEIVDDVHKSGKNWNVGYDTQGTAIPQLYKGGRLPRSLAPNIGKLDLLKALEVSSNPYFSLLAGDVIESPYDLVNAARSFSYGSRTGIDLPGEIAGKVPEDVEDNRTGLYSLAIGQHSLVVTPLQTAVMLSTIANGGKVFKPKIVSLTAGRERKSESDEIIYKQHFAYQESLAYVGVAFPLFTAVEHQEQASLIKRISTEVKREVDMPDVIRNVILKAMHRVTLRTQNEGAASLQRLYQGYPEALQSYTDLKSQLIGKTSTSEALENLNLDINHGTCMCKHVWFGGISFAHDVDKNISSTFVSHDQFGEPELVVVVYLRFGSYGKEAAPIAAQMIKKWREIQEKIIQ